MHPGLVGTCKSCRPVRTCGRVGVVWRTEWLGCVSLFMGALLRMRPQCPPVFIRCVFVAISSARVLKVELVAGITFSFFAVVRFDCPHVSFSVSWASLRCNLYRQLLVRLAPICRFGMGSGSSDRNEFQVVDHNISSEQEIEATTNAFSPH